MVMSTAKKALFVGAVTISVLSLTSCVSSLEPNEASANPSAPPTALEMREGPGDAPRASVVNQVLPDGRTVSCVVVYGSVLEQFAVSCDWESIRPDTTQ